MLPMTAFGESGRSGAGREGLELVASCRTIVGHFFRRSQLPDPIAFAFQTRFTKRERSLTPGAQFCCSAVSTYFKRRIPTSWIPSTADFIRAS